MNDRDRLIELVDKAKEEYANDITDHTETDYIVETLLNEGAILPPCKVGDTVYCIDYILKIVEKCKVYGLQIVNGKIQLLVDNCECKFVTSIWYLTKEEAKKALAERSEGNAQR